MSTLARMLGPLQRRIALMVARAIVQLADDSQGLQTVQITLLADEVRDTVERYQNYGFTSVPHPGAEAVGVSVMGSRDHVVIVAVDDRRYRLAGLQGGEVAIYTDEGDKIVLKRGNVIEVTAATKVSIVSPLVEMSGDLHVAGTITGDADLLIDGDATVAGNQVVAGFVSAGGNVESGGTVSGAVDVTAAGTSTHTHRHGGVRSGTDTSGTPI